MVTDCSVDSAIGEFHGVGHPEISPPSGCCRFRRGSFVVSVQAVLETPDDGQEGIMTKTGILATAAGALAVVSTALGAEDVKSGYVPANGVDYYYEIRGTGEPLLLLHGGLGSTGLAVAIRTRIRRAC
jgi:hypothetical protein